MRILVICAHPDDETIGCAGTLLAHHNQGNELYWLILTKAYTPKWGENVIRAKEAEVHMVARSYSMKEVFWPGLPSTQLDAIPINQIIVEVQRVLELIKPQWVYVVHHGDIHTDHHAVFKATTIVLKPFYMNKFGVRRLLSFECLSSTEAAPPLNDRLFIPNMFKDITPYVEQKIEIMNIYQTEIQADPLPRGSSAIRALARYRGSTIGVEYAEAFSMIREIF